ncbi:MAG: hypothetical protein CMQ46_05535 [Gammaproteobacteria bacterium]|nr:hypothetical protein [Gammaproteobacteria bacterium]MBJ54707.1 hypothetical protein [Gammaproteobacteria bacterium]|tara:strand:- start:634 stop:927 length:294 start_codon:yes stop_codon:yes gene_type:complete
MSSNIQHLKTIRAGSTTRNPGKVMSPEEVLRFFSAISDQAAQGEHFPDARKMVIASEAQKIGEDAWKETRSQRRLRMRVWLTGMRPMTIQRAMEVMS